jgi:hypothetical protein
MSLISKTRYTWARKRERCVCQGQRRQQNWEINRLKVYIGTSQTRKKGCFIVHRLHMCNVQEKRCVAQEYNETTNRQSRSEENREKVRKEKPQKPSNTPIASVLHSIYESSPAKKNHSIPSIHSRFHSQGSKSN